MKNLQRACPTPRQVDFMHDIYQIRPKWTLSMLKRYYVTDVEDLTRQQAHKLIEAFVESQNKKIDRDNPRSHSNPQRMNKD